MSTNTIILLILGVVILVVLILGFTMGWKQLAFWIPTDNVDTIVKQCSLACSTGKTYDFCSKPRTLRTEDVEFPDVTCEELSSDNAYDQYGIIGCPNIGCD